MTFSLFFMLGLYLCVVTLVNDDRARDQPNAKWFSLLRVVDLLLNLMCLSQKPGANSQEPFPVTYDEDR